MVEYLSLHQTIQRERNDFVGTARVPLNPVLRIVDRVGCSDVLERRVQKIVPRRIGINQIQRFRIGVEGTLECKIGEHGSRHNAGKSPARHHFQITGLFVKHQENQFFCKPQGEWRRYVFHVCDVL